MEELWTPERANNATAAIGKVIRLLSEEIKNMEPEEMNTLPPVPDGVPPLHFAIDGTSHHSLSEFALVRTPTTHYPVETDHVPLYSWTTREVVGDVVLLGDREETRDEYDILTSKTPGILACAAGMYGHLHGLFVTLRNYTLTVDPDEVQYTLEERIGHGAQEQMTTREMSVADAEGLSQGRRQEVSVAAAEMTLREQEDGPGLPTIGAR